MMGNLWAPGLLFSFPFLFFTLSQNCMNKHGVSVWFTRKDYFFSYWFNEATQIT
jgi:hypothetical protein